MSIQYYKQRSTFGYFDMIGKSEKKGLSLWQGCQCYEITRWDYIFFSLVFSVKKKDFVEIWNKSKKYYYLNLCDILIFNFE